MKIIIIGGSGLIGSKLMKILHEQGHEAIAASPKSGVNTLTGEGLTAVLKDAQVVIGGSNSPSFDDPPVMEFFKTSTGTLPPSQPTAPASHHAPLAFSRSTQ